MTIYSTSSPARFSSWFATVLVATVLTGCAATQPVTSSETTAIDPIVTRPDGSVREDTQQQAVAQLWASAERARLEGQDAIALELVYEALEINPQSAVLWSRAAEIQLDNLEAALAESYATKSNVYAIGNNALLYRNWLIIEHSRDMRGDLLGVRSAHKQVQQYQYQ